jgi:hypothetical protein
LANVTAIVQFGDISPVFPFYRARLEVIA